MTEQDLRLDQRRDNFTNFYALRKTDSDQADPNTGNNSDSVFVGAQPADLFCYLVRASNACGETLGTSSSGLPRATSACP